MIPFAASQIEEHRQRCHVGAAGVTDVEVLVLEPRADHGEVRLYSEAPGKIGAGVRETADSAADGVDAAVQLPVRSSYLAEEVHHRQRDGGEPDQVAREGLAIRVRRGAARRRHATVAAAEIEVIRFHPEQIDRTDTGERL